MPETSAPIRSPFANSPVSDNWASLPKIDPEVHGMPVPVPVLVDLSSTNGSPEIQVKIKGDSAIGGQKVSKSIDLSTASVSAVPGVPAEPSNASESAVDAPMSSKAPKPPVAMPKTGKAPKAPSGAPKPPKQSSGSKNSPADKVNKAMKDLDAPTVAEESRDLQNTSDYAQSTADSTEAGQTKSAKSTLASTQADAPHNAKSLQGGKLPKSSGPPDVGGTQKSLTKSANSDLLVAALLGGLIVGQQEQYADQHIAPAVKDITGASVPSLTKTVGNPPIPAELPSSGSKSSKSASPADKVKSAPKALAPPTPEQQASDTQTTADFAKSTADSTVSSETKSAPNTVADTQAQAQHDVKGLQKGKTPASSPPPNLNKTVNSELLTAQILSSLIIQEQQAYIAQHVTPVVKDLTR